MITKLRKNSHILVAVLCAAIALISTFVPTAMGPANNSDFLRVMHPNRIYFADENPRRMWDGYGHTAEFRMSLGTGGGLLGRGLYFLHTDFSLFNFPSSQILPIKLSKFLNLGFNAVSGLPLATYNLFWLALIHIAIFAYAIFLILGYIKNRFGGKIYAFSSLVAVFVLSDQGYTLYFNSFYGEGLQYVLTLLAIGLLLHLKGVRDFPKYFIVVYLMATSKFAWIPVGILFAIIPIFLYAKDSEFLRQRVLTYSGITVAALVLFYTFLIPFWIEDYTNFNAVFNGVLRNSETPAEDLEWLGLSPKFAVLQGFEMDMEDYPIDIFSEEFRRDFFEQISKPRILLFYLAHPVRFFGILQESAGYARFIRAPYLTSVQNPEYAGQQEYRFSLWEKTRISVAAFGNFYFIFWILVLSTWLSVAKMITIAKSGQGADLRLPILLFVLTAAAAFSFVIPYISNGIADQAKQLFGFISLFDLIFFGLVGWVVWRVDFGEILAVVRRGFGILAGKF
ncbi:MAG: hypothetical protein FWG65_01545 [Turicibacter sp.]|nr:hypothetical protein [Turicibacter sp.]